MLSSAWPAAWAFAAKGLALVVGLVAALVGWRAAHLWLQASRIAMPPIDPPLASIDDAPELHILSYSVQLNATAEAMRQSGALNAKAARWTSVAALLTGIAAIIAAL
ncbi:hypothetical protein WG901_22675 [Novosphingobium sp. PS1R-30]|uniref:Uncharacterized protein n=1 Tax=Novosphingobium anseongense TaxID=3133436 RepID=A0ABU8S3L8_9SPHN